MCPLTTHQRALYITSRVLQVESVETASRSLHTETVAFVQIKRKSGFSYVGLLIFIAILSVFATASVSIGSVTQRRDAEDELLFVGTQFRFAFQQYYEATPSGQPRYPTTLTDLIRDPRYPNVRRYLRRLYADPITGKADWVAVMRPEGGIMGVHSRSTAHPIKIGQFPDEFSTFENRTSYEEWIFFYK